jgi:hypothetical protein
MTHRKKRTIWVSVILTPVLLLAAYVAMGAFNVFHAHGHCIKAAGLGFKQYAFHNHGNLPYDTNGFGNALLIFVKGEYCSIGEVTGPGDNGSIFREALKTGAPIPEQKCSRIYIQGLSETNNPQIAILWDKKSSPGGDHFRRPWGPLLREVCLLDGSMQVIPEMSWAAFVSNQVDLLVQDGIPRATARHYYEIP